MANLEALNLLIEKAGRIAGTEYKLAQAMGIPQQILSDWKAGRRTCTAPDRARLAGFAGEDAVQELVRATLELEKNEKRKDQLYKLLGKKLLQTGAAHVGVLLSLCSLAFGIDQIRQCTMCNG